MAATRTVAFVTIGQSPRPDMVPEMLGWIGPGVTPIEVGALDGLDRAAIASLAPLWGLAPLVDDWPAVGVAVDLDPASEGVARCEAGCFEGCERTASKMGDSAE